MTGANKNKYNTHHCKSIYIHCYAQNLNSEYKLKLIVSINKFIYSSRSNKYNYNIIFLRLVKLNFNLLIKSLKMELLK